MSEDDDLVERLRAEMQRNPPPSTPGFDEDALIAAADVIGRAGAQSFEVGWLHDDVPSERAGWYAHAQFNGARIIADDHVGPVEAAEALARRLLTGARCRRCGQLISLASDAPGCRWTRNGPKWTPGCDLPVDPSVEIPPWVRRRS